MQTEIGVKTCRSESLMPFSRHWPRDISVQGRGASGVHFAMDFLTHNNIAVAGEHLHAPPLSAEGKTVLVIGGGDTGSDCIGTSLRQGASASSKRPLRRNHLEFTNAQNVHNGSWGLNGEFVTPMGRSRLWCSSKKAVDGNGELHHGLRHGNDAIGFAIVLDGLLTDSAEAMCQLRPRCRGCHRGIDVGRWATAAESHDGCGVPCDHVRHTHRGMLAKVGNSTCSGFAASNYDPKLAICCHHRGRRVLQPPPLEARAIANTPRVSHQPPTPAFMVNKPSKRRATSPVWRSPSTSSIRLAHATVRRRAQPVPPPQLERGIAEMMVA